MPTIICTTISLILKIMFLNKIFLLIEPPSYYTLYVED